MMITQISIRRMSLGSLFPRNDDGVLRVLVVERTIAGFAGGLPGETRIGIPEAAVRQEYDWPLEFDYVRVSGGNDSAAIYEAISMIASETWDLVFVEDFTRVSRTADLVRLLVRACVESQTRMISLNDRFDTAYPDGNSTALT